MLYIAASNAHVKKFLNQYSFATTTICGCGSVVCLVIFSLSFDSLNLPSALYFLSSDLSRYLSLSFFIASSLDVVTVAIKHIKLSLKKERKGNSAPPPLNQIKKPVSRGEALSGVPALSQSIILNSIKLPPSPFTTKEIGRGSRRRAVLIGEHNIVLKNLFDISSRHQSTIYHDCLAYPLSIKLGLNVIPKICYVPGEHNNSYGSYAVNKGTILQEYIEPCKAAVINQESAQKALIYQWITQRSDPTRENSIIDKEGMVYEIDNELIFDDHERFPHWLLNPKENPQAHELENSILSKTLLNNIYNQIQLTIDTTGLHESWEKRAKELCSQADKRVHYLKMAISALGGPETAISCKQLFERANNLVLSNSLSTPHSIKKSKI